MSVCPGVSGDGPDRFVWPSLSQPRKLFLRKAIVVRRDAGRHQGLRDRFADLGVMPRLVGDRPPVLPRFMAN